MKPTDYKYPLTDLTEDEQQTLNSMLKQLDELVDQCLLSREIPLDSAVKVLGAGTYVVVHLSENFADDPDVETVIKTQAPEAVVRHVKATRRTDIENQFQGSIKLAYTEEFTSKDLLTSKLAIYINEDKQIRLFRGQPFPVGTRFTI